MAVVIDFYLHIPQYLELTFSTFTFLLVLDLIFLKKFSSVHTVKLKYQNVKFYTFQNISIKN